MVGRGLLVDGRFDVGGGARRAGPAAGAPGRVVHRSGPRPWRPCSRSCWACRRRTPCTGSRCPAGPRSGRRCWCRSCCPPWWSAWRSASCSGRAARWACLGLDGTPIAIVCGLVFFNVAVVVRTVGVAWESLDPRPGPGGGRARRLARRRCCGRSRCPRCAPRSSARRASCSCSARPRSGSCSPSAGCATPPSRPRSTCSPPRVFDLRAAAALSLLQIVVVVGLLALAARLRATPDPTAQTCARARARRTPCATPRCVVATVLRARRDGAADRRPRARLAAASTRAGGSATTARSRPPATTRRSLVPVTAALATWLRTAVDATWMALLVGVTVSAHRDPALALGRRAAGALDARRLLHAAARRQRRDPRLRLPHHPRPARRSTCGTPRCWCRSPRRWSPCRWSCAPLTPVLGGIDDRQRQAAASLGASPWRTLLTVDLPVVWKPLLAASGFAFAVSLGEFGATPSSPATTTRRSRW